MLGYMLCILVGAPLGILLGKAVTMIWMRALWGKDYYLPDIMLMDENFGQDCQGSANSSDLVNK